MITDRLWLVIDGLIASVVVVFTALIQMIFLSLLITFAFIALALLRWGLSIVLDQAVATYKRLTR